MARDITQLHPRLQEKAEELVKLCKKNGITIKIGECFRSVKEQNDLYAQGRTKPGNKVTNAKGTSYSSQHQWGIAMDFFLDMDIDGDGKKSDDAFNNKKKTFNKVGKFAKSIGLGWGGDWKNPVDLPHVYLKDWGSTTSKLKSKYGTPDKFMKTWEVEEKPEEKPKTETPKKTTKKKYPGTFPALPPRGYFKVGDGYKTLTNFTTQIKHVQKLLNWIMDASIKVDGDYGEKTAELCEKYQEKYGLAVDGQFGSKSRAKAKTIKK